MNTPSKSHEPNAWNSKWVLWAMAAFFGSVLLTHLLMLGLEIYFQSEERPVASTEEEHPTITFPAAELNPHQPQTLAELRRTEKGRLTSYGWVDQDYQIAHIPVEQAIDVLADQGFPAKLPGVKLATTEKQQLKEAQP